MNHMELKQNKHPRRNLEVGQVLWQLLVLTGLLAMGVLHALEL